MNGVSTRLRRRIERDFPGPGSAREVVRIVAEASPTERVQAAIVLAAEGELRMIRDGAELAGIDWRDVSVNGGLAHEDWAQELDRQLGPGGPP
jgi:integrase